MAVYQMHFAVAAEHRCTDTGADTFHYLVVLMCGSRPDPSTGDKTGAEYDNPQCQQDKYVNISVDTDTAFETDGDTNDAIITVEYSDAPAVGELTVEKKGEVLDGFKGGLLASSYEKEFVYKEGSLAGAKFKVYAAEDIYTADNQKDADGNRIKYYSKGDLVTTLTTGKDGKATVKNLPLGQYRVVEVEAPYGYVLNPNEQKVTFTYVDDKTPVIKESLTFSDDRQKLDMSVTKLDAEDNTPIAGAVFGLYADEDIKNVAGKVIIEKGTLLEKATSDENGKIAFVKDYPFAKYVARELVKPAGYVTNEEAVNFDTKYQGQDVKTAVYNSEYKNTPTTFEFTKTDITSGAELTGATLTVLDKDGNVVDTWTSDAKEAHVIKRLVVGETYTLREEFAPYGYLKATDIQFTVEDTGKVQHVEMKDEVPTGSIVINKDGEFVTDTTLMKGYWYDFIFNFFKDSLAGVTFDVYAKEDIVSADGLDTVYHKAGDKVATIVTNDKGIARIDDLPLGKYYLVETKTIDGFVLDDTPIEADLSYIDQNTKVVFAGMDVTNERQKVQITVTKTDSETKEALEGAVFGLFAKEDIVNKDGKVIVKADTQIERTVTGKDGKAAFTSDLPLGQYYVKEIEAPKGYVKSDKIFDVDASYQGDKVKVIEFKAAFENAPIKVEISKTDITGEKELPGAKLSVIDADGKLVESWTSEAGKTHMIERLPVGKYTLREESAPYGYKVASDVTFEVKETAEIQKVSMKDEQAVGKIVIEKTDKVTGKPIEGVVFEVRDKDGKVLDTLTTDKNGHAESKELMMDKDAFINRVRGYQGLAERMRAVAASKNANLSDVTISKKLIIEENDHAVKTRVPGTWGEEAKYVWLRKENIMEIHGGKTMLTFLDSTKDYKLYDEQNRVVTTQKGTELYTHYDKVESSVRERYEKVQKQQKKTTQKKTVTTKKAR